MDKGVVILITGNGKGKTTSALGQTFRAMGHDWKVCFLQFIKGDWATGELNLSRQFGERLLFRTLGQGFTWEGEREKHIAAAREAWQYAVEQVNSDRWDLVVLDELTYLVSYKIISEQEVLDLIKNRPPRLNLLITGRGASQALIDACDIVSEVQPVKFPAYSRAPRHRVLSSVRDGLFSVSPILAHAAP